MRAEVLTDEQKRYGKLSYLNFCMYNGFSVALIAESTLILYSLKFGVPDYIVGIMASFVFLGIPFLILGKKFVINFGTSGTVSKAWFFRNLCGILTIFAPIVSYYTSLEYGIAVIIIGAFGFYSFRGVGMIAFLPLVGEITDKDDLGDFNGRAFFRYNMGYFLSILALVVLFHYYDSLFTFQIVIAVGGIFGIIASFHVKKVPETSMPRKSASVSIRDSLIFVFKYPALRKLIYGQTIYFIGLALILPYSMLALKESYHLSDFKAFEFVLAQFLGAMLISHISKKLIKVIGSRNLLVLLFLFQVIIGGLWLLSPLRFNWIYCGFIFLFLGMVQFGGYLALSHYFLAITPPESRIGSTMIISAVSSILAGLCGAVIGGGLLRLLERLNFHSLDKFHYYFSVIIIITVIGYLAVLKLERINLLHSVIKTYKLVVKK
jgi:hypothetical protein